MIDVRWNEAVSSIAAALPRLTVALLIVSIAAGLRIPRKYFELVSHFRVQYLVASTAFLLISFAEANWWCAAGALLAAVINASRIVPYYAAKLPGPYNFGTTLEARACQCVSVQSVAWAVHVLLEPTSARRRGRSGID